MRTNKGHQLETNSCSMHLPLIREQEQEPEQGGLWKISKNFVSLLNYIAYGHNDMEFKLSQLCVPRTIKRNSLSKYNPISTQKQLHLHVQVYRCQKQGMSSNTQESTSRFLVHVVKEGETLNSISKIYGVPACDIAAVNEKVSDFDPVFEGQLLNIPSSITIHVQKGKRETTTSRESSSSSGTGRGSVVSLCSRFLNMNNSTVASVRHLSHAKTTGYFLVLVPLIAFCIRCVMGALNSRHTKDLDHSSSESESERCLHGTKRMRWKTALLDLRDPDDELDTSPRPEIDFREDEYQQMGSNDLSNTYGKLEEDYKKFLSECGIRNWGHWRGGSSE